MDEIKAAIEGLREHFKVIAYDWCGDVDEPTAHFQTVEKWVALAQRAFDEGVRKIARLDSVLDSQTETIARLTAALEEEKSRTAKLREAQTCASCKSLICPPMQCGRCIETERPVEGMPERPATTNLRERVRELTAALEEARDQLRRTGFCPENLTTTGLITILGKAHAIINKALTPAGGSPPRPGP